MCIRRSGSKTVLAAPERPGVATSIRMGWARRRIRSRRVGRRAGTWRCGWWAWPWAMRVGHIQKVWDNVDVLRNLDGKFLKS